MKEKECFCWTIILIFFLLKNDWEDREPIYVLQDKVDLEATLIGVVGGWLCSDVTVNSPVL